ncbi:Testicular acid phosphatase [Nymphon striatum]|nr:Testicular acid phosphatase [Nymphon striatum]
MDILIGFIFFSFYLTSSCSAQELKLSQVVYRHGQRSPSLFYPNDPHKKFWADGRGQLTNVGRMDEYKLGQFLRKRYDNNKFLNKTFKHSDIYVRSSEVNRVLESAELVLAGLYPPYKNNIWNKNLLWQPIAVHSVPKKVDYLLEYYGTDCPRFLSEYQKATKVDPLKAFEEKYQSLYKYLSTYSGMKEVNQTNAWIVYDDSFNEMLHNLTPPAWVLNNITQLKEQSTGDFVLLVPNKELKKLKGGPLVKEIISNFDKNINNESLVKMYQFSTHDTILAVLMSTLKIFNDILPPYSSAIIFELFKNKSGNASHPEDTHSVKISYRNDSRVDPFVLSLPGCAQLCPLEKFKSLTKDIIPEDIAKECGLSTPNYAASNLTFHIIFECSNIFRSFYVGDDNFSELHRPVGN